MKNRPFFTVVTCTYNSEAYIRQNITSVVEQTYANYEHLIVDGYSEDRTLQIAKEIATSKLRIISVPPQGISDALNTGVNSARGTYIIHLNSDDYFFSNNVLDTIATKIEKNNYPDLLYGKIQVIEEDGTKIGQFPERWIFQLANFTLLKFFNFIPHQATFVKQTVFKRYGAFDTTLKSSMDYDFWLRVCRFIRWNFVDCTISNYRLRPGAQSSSLANKKHNMRYKLRVLQTHLNKYEYYVAVSILSILTSFSKLYR